MSDFSLEKVLYDMAIVGDPTEGGNYTIVVLEGNPHGIRISWSCEDGRTGADTVSSTGLGHYLAYLKMLKMYPLEIIID